MALVTAIAAQKLPGFAAQETCIVQHPWPIALLSFILASIYKICQVMLILKYMDFAIN